MAFALLLESACESFEILTRLITGETTVVSKHGRDGPRIQMALAKDFLFFAVRAHRVCKHGAGNLSLPRDERTRFKKALGVIVAVRDVNEHGFDANSRSKPSMHVHENHDSTLDETALIILGPHTILLGPLNLFDIYGPIARMRDLAGFAAVHKRECTPPAVK